MFTKALDRLGPLLSVVAVLSLSTLPIFAADEAKLVKLGEWGVANYVEIEQSGGVLYAAAGEAGVDVLELGEMSSPTRLTRIEPVNSSQGVAVVGSTLAVANRRGGFSLYDVTDPNEITQTADFNFPDNGIAGSADAVALSDDRNTLFVLNSISGVQAFDVNNVNNIALVSTVPSLVSGKGRLDLNGNLLTVQNNLNDLQVLDVSDPSMIVDTNNFDVSGFQINSFVQAGNTGYLGTNASGLQVIDFTDPNTPALITTLPGNSDFQYSELRHMVIDGNTLFVLVSSQGLVAFDISTPTAPVELGNFVVKGIADDFTLSGAQAVVSSQDFGVTQLNLENLAAITEFGSFSESTVARSVSSDGTTAILAGERAGAIVLDVADAQSITEVTRELVPTDFSDTSEVRAVLRDGDTLFVSGNNRVQIFDISDQANPQALGLLNDPGVGVITSFALDSGNLYAADIEGQLTVIDVSDLNFPSILGLITVAPITDMAFQTLTDIAIVGDRLYGTSSLNDLHVVDISDPVLPVVLSSTDFLAGSMFSQKTLEAEGDRVFLGLEDGVYIVNVSDDLAPAVVGTEKSIGRVTGLAVADDLAYATFSLSGDLALLNISDETQPTILDISTLPADANFVAVSGTDAYVTTRFTGKLEVYQTNLPAVASAGNFATDEDVDLSAMLEATDPNASDTLSFAVVTQPANGTVTVANDGSFTYQPVRDFFGQDSFTFSATDGINSASQATASLTINSVNDDPVMEPQAFDVLEDMVLTNTVVASDVDSTNLSFAKATDPSSGTVTVSPNGAFTYTPMANFFGNDSFEVVVDDGVGGTAQATVTVNVESVNDLPVASADAVTGDEDTQISGSATATDVENSAITFSSGAAPANGSIVVNADGTFVYTPNSNFNGSDSFDVNATDADGGVGAVTVAVTVDPVNDAPTANSGSFTTNTGTALNSSVTGSDVDGDSLTFALDSGTANGTITFNSNGSFTYQATEGFTGTDSFTFSVTDPDGESAQATGTISVTRRSGGGGGGSVPMLMLTMLGLVAMFRKRS